MQKNTPQSHSAQKPKSKQKPKKTRQEINEESRELKRKRKHKGLPSGSRFNDGDSGKNKNGQKQAADPRIGSKKPISLIEKEVKKDATNSIKEPKLPKPIKKALLPEQELEQLENDPLLEQLLDLVEQDSKLTKEQQNYLDTKLSRIDELMMQLGYTDDDFDDELDDQDEKKEDIVGLLKRK